MSTEQPENTPKVSSAKDFKKKREAREQGAVLTLSSGLVVRVKRPNVQILISRGLIPAQMVQGFLNIQDSKKGASNLKPDELKQLLDFQRIVASQALVDPKCVDEPDYDKNEISVEDIDADDLDEIWAYVNGGLEAVEKFRGERNSGNVSGPDSEAVSKPSS